MEWYEISFSFPWFKWIPTIPFLLWIYKSFYFDENEILQTIHAYNEYCAYDTHSKKYDSDISVIEYFYISSEEEVRNALLNISSRLDNKNDIPFYYYGKLATNLVKLHTVLDYDYHEIKDKMIRNCIEAPTNFDIDVLLIPTMKNLEKSLLNQLILIIQMNLNSIIIQII